MPTGSSNLRLFVLVSLISACTARLTVSDVLFTRDTFYRYKEAVDNNGVDALLDKSRRHIFCFLPGQESVADESDRRPALRINPRAGTGYWLRFVFDGMMAGVWVKWNRTQYES